MGGICSKEDAAMVEKQAVKVCRVASKLLLLFVVLLLETLTTQAEGVQQGAHGGTLPGHGPSLCLSWNVSKPSHETLSTQNTASFGWIREVVPLSGDPVPGGNSYFSSSSSYDTRSLAHSHSIIPQNKSGEPQRKVQTEGSESGKSFADLYRLGKQVSAVVVLVVFIVMETVHESYRVSL